jgi:hypothetical protein
MHDIKYIDKNGTPHITKSETEATLYSNKDVFAYTIGDMNFVLISNDGDLFNPFDSSANRNKKDLEKGDLFYNLRKCNKTCFDYYTMFLKTKNRTHLTLAQRNYLN